MPYRVCTPRIQDLPCIVPIMKISQFKYHPKYNYTIKKNHSIAHYLTEKNRPHGTKLPLHLEISRNTTVRIHSGYGSNIEIKYQNKMNGKTCTHLRLVLPVSVVDFPHVLWPAAGHLFSNLVELGDGVRVPWVVDHWVAFEFRKHFGDTWISFLCPTVVYRSNGCCCLFHRIHRSVRSFVKTCEILIC